MALTFSDQFGINSLDDIDLGIGRLDIAESTNAVFNPVGALEGTAALTLRRTPHPVKAGTPMQIVVMFSIEDGGTLKCTLIEGSTVANMDRQLAQPTSLYTTNTAVTGSTYGNAETVVASLGNAVPLANDNLQIPPAVIVKDSTGATTYTLTTDYTIDAIHGTLTAVNGGAITNGQSLRVQYAFFLPTKKLTYGGFASVRAFRLQWSHQRPQDSNWEVFVAYKAYPTLELVRNYIQNSHNVWDMTFELASDITRTQGDRIGQIRIQTQQPF